MSRDFAPYKQGDLVEANWKGGGRWFQGRIADITEQGVFVEYFDGDQEWITDGDRIKKLRKLDSDLLALYQVGDEVEGDWKGRARWYRGTVGEISEYGIFVLYRDGDREWITSFDRLRKLDNATPAQIVTKLHKLWEMTAKMLIEDVALYLQWDRKALIEFLVEHRGEFPFLQFAGKYITNLKNSKSL